MEKIYIKNMVCNRCIMVVKTELEKMGIKPLLVDLGEVTLENELPAEQKQAVDNKLQEFGFAVIDDKKAGSSKR